MQKSKSYQTGSQFDWKYFKTCTFKGHFYALESAKKVMKLLFAFLVKELITFFLQLSQKVCNHSDLLVRTWQFSFAPHQFGLCLHFQFHGQNLLPNPFFLHFGMCIDACHFSMTKGIFSREKILLFWCGKTQMSYML